MKYIVSVTLSVLIVFIVAYIFEPTIKTWPMPVALVSGFLWGSLIEAFFLIALDRTFEL